MIHLIDKDVLVAEIERRISVLKANESNESVISMLAGGMFVNEFKDLLSFIDTLEVKKVKKSASIAYVVTRCEEHSDYVEKVFFNEDKAQEYCGQFKGNENEYARHITRVEVTL